MTLAFDNHWSIACFVSGLIAIIAFFCAFVASAGYTLQEYMLKAKRVSGIQKYLPALGTADRISYKMAALGFFMLTICIISYSVESQLTKGSIWQWNPAQSWLIITWLVYAAFLHVRGINGWRGRWTNRLLAAGFVCVIVTLSIFNISMGAWH